MASENEASCESDPNFAVICGFLEKFGTTCGLTNIDFVDLQDMLENTQEVHHELITLHVKLMRRAHRSVSSNDRWERALIKTCHTFSSQDAWEIERFGYKKARITSKLRILKELLEMQFDYNQKFKTEINKMAADELRTQPLGRDRMGRAYWYQCDEHCQIRVYKDDADDETWNLVAKDRASLVSLISQLGNGDTAKSSSEPVSNEDSNSVEVEKPTLDTGQTKPESPKSKIDSDNTSDEKMEIDAECTANITIVENRPEDSSLRAAVISNDADEKEKSAEENTNEEQNTNEEENTNEGENKVEETNKVEITSNVKEPDGNESEKIENEDNENEKSPQDDVIEKDVTDNGEDVEDLKEKSPEDSSENALNLCSKDLSNNKEDIKDDKACLDLSLKTTPSLRIKPITELMPQPHLEMQKKEFMGIKGSGFSNESVNEKENSPIVGEEIEEPVLYVSGEGNGKDCETGNKCLGEADQSKSKESDHSETSVKTQSLPSNKSLAENLSNENSEQTSQPPESDCNASEAFLDNANCNDTSSGNISSDSSPDNVSSPVRQTFFFGNSFSPSTSPIKSASLSFGASTVVDNQNEISRSISPAPEEIEGAKHSIEKTDENLVGNHPSHSKVPENVDTIDNTKDISERLSPVKREGDISKESEGDAQQCDKTLISTIDANINDIHKDKVDCSEVNLTTTVMESAPEQITNKLLENTSPNEEFSKESDSDVGHQSQTTAIESETLRSPQCSQSSNDIEAEATTPINCTISKSPLLLDSEENQANTLEITMSEGNVSSTVFEEEPTTSDKICPINAANNSKKIEDVSLSQNPDSSLEDRQVSSTPEIQTVTSGDGKVNSDEVTSQDDVPTSTTYAEEIGCNSEDMESSNLVTSENVINSEPIKNVNHDTNITELITGKEKCQVESLKNIPNNTSNKEDMKSPEKESNNDLEVINNSDVEEDNDLNEDKTFDNDENTSENVTQDEQLKEINETKLDDIGVERKVTNSEGQPTDIDTDLQIKDSDASTEVGCEDNIEENTIENKSTTEETENTSKSIHSSHKDKKSTMSVLDTNVQDLDVDVQENKLRDSDEENTDLEKDLDDDVQENKLKDSDEKNTDFEKDLHVDVQENKLKDSDEKNTDFEKDLDVDVRENKLKDSDEKNTDFEKDLDVDVQENKLKDSDEKNTDFEEDLDVVVEENKIKDSDEKNTAFEKDLDVDVQENKLKDSDEKNTDFEDLDVVVEENKIKDSDEKNTDFEKNLDVDVQENKLKDSGEKNTESEKDLHVDVQENKLKNSDEKNTDFEKTNVIAKDPEENTSTTKENEKIEEVINIDDETGTELDKNTEKVPEDSVTPLIDVKENKDSAIIEETLAPELEDKHSPVILVETDDETSDNRCGIDALKAIKITSVQAKCEIVEDTTRDNLKVKQNLSSNEKITAPQPLRFLRGRRPNQMLSVKSYATRNKNLVLRKEIKPQIQDDENKIKNNKIQNKESKIQNKETKIQNREIKVEKREIKVEKKEIKVEKMNIKVEKKEIKVDNKERNNRNNKKDFVPNVDPLLNVVKIEENAENNFAVRRSTRRKPGDVNQPQTAPVEVFNKVKGRQKKIPQPTHDTKHIEETDVRHSKRLRLSNNKGPGSTNVETIDLTSETDGRKISVKNCDENTPLRGGVTIKPIYKEDEKSSQKNGPFLTCVNIQKLKENPVDHADSPLSVESSGGGDNSDVVIIEDDPLAVPEISATVTSKSVVTLNSFQLDVDYTPPVSSVITRSLRKRGITEAEIPTPIGGKRRKTKGKRQVDLELRRSIEEQKKQEVSSSEDENNQEMSPKRKPQPFKKKQEDVHSDKPPVETVKKPRAPRKKTLLGLDVSAVIQELDISGGNVRQSRRIAQLKIKEEAERRKLEEVTMTEPKDSKKKAKKNEDKDYKAEKRKRTKAPTEDEVTVDVPEVEEKKTKRKRKRKHKDPRKIFDEANPWRSSSGSSSSNDEVEEEEEIVEYSEAESPLFKSDHEFSPESDIEDTGEPLPLKRARTARKEDDIEDDVDEHACQKCGKSDHPEWILLCDGCDNGWHCSCLRPALFIIPEGDWFCPPCQHNSLVKQLEAKLVEYDKKMAKREIEVRRKERLAYVGISLANVLPVKDSDEKRKKKNNSEDEEDEEDTPSEQSSSESSSSSDSDEPIYQLRQRRQAHSYRFNDYDDLINSAIQDEMEAVKGAGNQGRGKDISTIVNAEKEEKEKEKEEQEKNEELEPPPPVVPVETKELSSVEIPAEHHDSEEEKVKPVKKFLGRKKQRKLNCLDISSGDDPDSDEDFKGSSSDEDDDDDFEEDMGSDSSEAYVGRRKKGMPVRRSTRARTSRYDKDFINDDSEDEAVPRKKKSRSAWSESETEESDTSWKWSSRKKSSRNITKKKRSKKSKKHFDDSDEDRSKKKKRRIKYGGLNDDEDEEETAGRRTRGKKINYADVLATDSEDEVRGRKAPPRIESDDDYVANEDEEDNDEELEKEESVDKKKSAPPDVNEKSLEDKDSDKLQPSVVEETQSKPAETKSSEVATVEVLSENVPPTQIASESIQEENFDLDNLNSSIDDLPDDIADDNDVDDELNPIDEINKNLEEMDEAEMEKLMEEEEYANKQLQLVAMQLEKEKKRREREAKKKESGAGGDTKTPKKRGRKASSVVQIATLQIGPDMQSNPELSEPPGITIPIFSEIPPSKPIEGSPKKRRGRGKGKKTLEKEAAAAAAAAAASTVTGDTQPAAIPTSLPKTADDQPNIPTTVDTVANVNSDDMALANAAAIHGAKLAIAAPPQPFSQTQPTPSVITRMLQTQPGAGNYSPMGLGHNYYADQPPPHAENSPIPPVSNSQMATCVPVSNSIPTNTNPGQLPPISQMQQPYMHGAPPPRGMSPSIYRQPPPNVNPYQRTSPAPPIQPIRARNPSPAITPVYHTHHPLDPSPSGGGPINVTTSSINTPDRSSPISIPPTSDSPLSNKSDPTPPPPPYSRSQMRFSNVTTSPMTGSPIRQNQQQPQSQQPNLLPPQHIQPQTSPLRNNMPPYHPASVPPNYYGSFMQGGIGPDDALPPSGYQYSDQFSETNSPQDIGKSYDEENSGEFGGLVSYFSSQREDDLDT
ncbi:histone acetyltransferase [Holotrichia oblita]|uniref:Histone acetyltransferase n=1 Tax=Holotrichia oblita TaxID=644536 RepID=A0ACB9SYR0_HOLOL|nr:histone acetyltransferase [Holotrichia oblita]